MIDAGTVALAAGIESLADASDKCSASSEMDVFEPSAVVSMALEHE